MKYNRLHKGIILLATLLITGCNKDGDIEIDAPVDVTPPSVSDVSAFQTRVFEYCPAPGQFINDPVKAGFSETVTTPEAAIAYAQNRLDHKKFVSLGAFGGYIVVGFDHPIVNTHGDYDFVIMGNAHEGSNEPGTVWVMQDSNRNGLPDDEWFELRGSETDAPGTFKEYSVTYYRPHAPKSDVAWTDSEGNSGTIAYLEQYHDQGSYYPAWIEADSYTLTGTRIEPRNTFDTATGTWYNNSYSWGYADNCGADAIDGNPQLVGFKIDNAMTADGTPIELESIDFVKVQQAVLAQSGWIGENSCEVLFIADYSMMRR